MFLFEFVPKTNGVRNGIWANRPVERFAGIAGTFRIWRGNATTMSEPTLLANVALSAPGAFGVLDICTSTSAVNAAALVVLVVERRPTPKTGVLSANGFANTICVR